MIPHCDLATGKIYGCKRGSWKWWHEKGHYEFNKIPNFSLLILLKGYLHDVWIFFIMATFIFSKSFYLAVICWVIYFSIFIYEEWWCNSYADRKWSDKSNH